MRGLTILRGVPITAIADFYGTGSQYLLTPDPKEAWVANAAGTGSIDLNLGTLTEIDTIFLGYTNAAATATWTIQELDGAPGVLLPASTMRIDGGRGPRYHALAMLAAPVSVQNIRLTLTQPAPAAPLNAGVLMVGKRFEHAYEFKSGRRPLDLSERVELASGGFGFGDGAIKSSFRFTFADLDDGELDDLWNEIMAVGARKPVLLVEGGDGAIAHNQVHYGVFERFEPYERDNPADTRWSLSMQDWV